MEAQECLVIGGWLDLVSLMLTSADLIIQRVAEKGKQLVIIVLVSGCSGISFYRMSRFNNSVLTTECLLFATIESFKFPEAGESGEFLLKI